MHQKTYFKPAKLFFVHCAIGEPGRNLRYLSSGRMLAEKPWCFRYRLCLGFFYGYVHKLAGAEFEFLVSKLKSKAIVSLATVFSVAGRKVNEAYLINHNYKTQIPNKFSKF